MGRGGTGRPRRPAARRRKEDNDEVPEVFQEMLAEAAQSTGSRQRSQNRVVKRRRLEKEPHQVAAEDPDSSDAVSTSNGQMLDSQGQEKSETTKSQVIFDDFPASDDDEEGDFEEVDLEADIQSHFQQEVVDHTLDLDLSKKPRDDASFTVRRRKPATVAERKVRVDVHKWHVLCLLAHLQQRNQWCEDDEVQATLKPLIPRKVLRLLHLDASQEQYQRTHSFNSAIDEISKIWRGEWRTTEQGMRRSYWQDEPDDLQNVEDFPDPVDFQDFRDAARSRSGSRDLGAQLLCSLLRAAAVDTRLVCSLQPLPLSGVAKGAMAEMPKSQYITAASLGRQPQWKRPGDTSTSLNSRWRVISPEPGRSEAIQHSKKAQKAIRDSPYPIFWVEAFSEAIQTWIPIDPLVRRTINKPKTGFEPPASDPLNNMLYVVAVEDDGSARDVTRRYVRFYNGKTRRNRVESTVMGQQWWEKTMSHFEKPFPEDRDEIETAELLAREESEQMPKNVQDFKNHPHYILERHLRRNEVIHPKREVGKISVGQTRDAKLEHVFRRRDLLVVRTADQWYRRGRNVKIGEQPLKEAVVRKRNSSTPIGEYRDVQGEQSVMLYAESQTEVYVPPYVVDGRVPRNAYGNLDVYVSSMIPAGGIHVQHLDAARAAKVLGIDYVDAVTGFQFKGRQGTAVVSGIVAAAEYREALVEVLESIQYERACEKNEKKTTMALHAWKRFLTALRIRENVNMKYANEMSPTADESDDAMDGTYREIDHDSDEIGGGFFPEPTAESEVLPQPAKDEPKNIESSLDLQSTIDIDASIIVQESPHRVQQNSMATSEQKPIEQNASPPVHSQSGVRGGGFLAENEEGSGGGFLIHDPSTDANYKTESGLADDISASDPHSVGATLERSKMASHLHDNRFPANTDIIPDSRTNHPLASFSTPNALNTATSTSTAKATINENISQPPPSTTTQVPSLIKIKNDADTIDDNDKKEREEKDKVSSDESADDTSLEQGSLLSHDPEDDDAEPAWLAEVVDSD